MEINVPRPCLRTQYFPFPRAVTFTVAVFPLAAGAHVPAGGSLPEPAIFAGLVALVLAPVVILAKIRITAPVMVGLLAAGELVLHEAFNALSVSAAFTPGPGGHLHGTGPVPPLAGVQMPEHAAARGR